MDLDQSTDTRPRARVLLVEDESKLRETLVEGLRLEDWAVIGAGTGAEARQQIDAHDFDLIVLDWILPDCDSLEIVRRMRSRGSAVPVLMITAHSVGTTRETLLQAGATDFLAKPFGFDDLLRRSRALLGEPQRTVAT